MNVLKKYFYPSQKREQNQKKIDDNIVIKEGTEWLSGLLLNSELQH